MNFYLHRNEEIMKGCEETRDFCKFVNDMFDALNRKQPNEGLTPMSPDFEVNIKTIILINKVLKKSC